MNKTLVLILVSILVGAFGCTPISTLQEYVSKQYILRFKYPEEFEVKKEVFSYSDELYILRGGEEIGAINIQLLEVEEWEKDPFNKVSNKTPLFVGVEEVGGVGWNTYLLTNNQGHLFNVGCLQSECDWILSGVSFDESLVVLDEQFLTGGWSTEGDFSEIDLNDDGSYSSFLHERPFDDGKWEFIDDTLMLKSNVGSEMDKIFKNISKGEGGGYIFLEDESGTDLTWMMN